MSSLKGNGQNKEYISIEDDYQKSYGIGVRHLQMVAMTLTITCLYIARSSMGVAVLAMSGEGRKNDTLVTVYEWDKKTQSLILSAFFWGYVIMQIPGGLLAKKFGGRLVLLISLLINGTLCCMVPTLAAVGGWPLVCVSRVAMGLSQACLFPAAYTLLSQWFPPNERTSYTGIVFGGTQFGTIIAMPLSGFLADTVLGWKLIFYTLSGILFLDAAVWYWCAASTPAEHRLCSPAERLYITGSLASSSEHKTISTPWKKILTSIRVWALFAGQIGGVLSFILFLVDMPTYLEKGLHISLKESATLSALPFVGMWLGNTIPAIIAEKLMNRKIIRVGPCRKLFNSLGMFGVAGALICLSFLGPENKVLAIVVIVVSLTMNGFTSAGVLVNFLDIAPNFGGLIYSIANFLANIGASLLPICTSYILQNDSSNLDRWRIVFLVTAAIAAGTNIFYLTFSTSEKQDWNQPEYYDKIKAVSEEMKPVLQSKCQKYNEKDNSITVS